MLRIILVLAALVAFGTMLACNNAPAAAGSPTDSPTDAYRRLYAAVKSKNTDSIKAEMTQKTLDFAQMVSAKNGTPIEKVFENGFTATTFSTELPQIRDQRVADNMGAVEVWNSKDNKWEDLPFIKNENGAWQIAVGDLFSGTYKSPGPGKDQRDKAAANANGSGPIQAPVANSNVNGNVNAGVNPIPANMPPPPAPVNGPPVKKDKKP